MPIKLLRRGHGGPPGSTEVTAMNSIGIDYHKRYSVVCVMDEAGSILAEERIDHAFPERFAELIGKHTPAQVAVGFAGGFLLAVAVLLLA